MANGRSLGPMRSARRVLVGGVASAALALTGAAPAMAAEAAPVSAAARETAPAHGLGVLTDLFAERLLLADKVAAAKYGTDRPIDDPAREKVILDDVAARAVGLGLDPAAVQAVFRDQIEANKLVQHGLYARWDAHPEERPTTRPDLDKEVRPALNLITTQILQALQETQAVRASRSCEVRLGIAALRSAYDHELDLLHQAALGRALPSVCSS
jgi:chorismate mutase